MNCPLPDAEGLVKALLANRIDENVELVQAFTRMYNLVKDVTYTGVDESLLKEDAERALYEMATKHLKQVSMHGIKMTMTLLWQYLLHWCLPSTNSLKMLWLWTKMKLLKLTVYNWFV